ncbi:plant/protein [Perilla frutescens var. hirtella]|nr:plant/protein [Perilla frutescens var. hirtella]KAH6811727.1 plant/protein [Perilla frutescens var. frutescens]
MSLALLQSYSSADEEEEDPPPQFLADEISSGDEANDVVPKATRSYKPLFDTNPPSSSSLPSAFDAFSEVAGPPQFLNNSVQEETVKEDVQRWRHGGRRNRKEKKNLPSGAVLESKPQLVGIHERVRSDIVNSASEGKSNGSAASTQGGKRMATVANPNAEDAAELLRMCLACGVPKTYSHAKGMVCPMCGDRAPTDSDKEVVKKKGSAVKDKEKSKRMKGQSSHATWKSETEMQLRQQFD